MNNELNIRTLLDRFFLGDTTLAEEQKLYDYFRQTPVPQLPRDLAPLRDLFLDLQAVRYAATPSQPRLQPSPLQPSQPCLQPSQPRHQPSQPRHRRRWLAAAALALLLAAGALTLFRPTQADADSGEELVAYIYGKRTTDPAVVIGEMQHTMAAMTAEGGADVVEQQLKTMFSN